MMKQFGHQKFMPKPKTEKDWTRIFNRHKYEVPKIKKLHITLSSKGPGQTGARHFKAYAIPPLKHWNPKLEVSVTHDVEKPVEPQIVITFDSGDTKTIDIKGANLDTIKANLFAVGATPRAAVGTTETASAPL